MIELFVAAVVVTILALIWQFSSLPDQEFTTCVILVILTAGFLYMLSGCAAEPRAPIQAYREQYGFTP